MKKPLIVYNGHWAETITLNIVSHTQHEIRLLTKENKRYVGKPNTIMLPSRRLQLRRSDIINFVYYRDYKNVLDELKPAVIISNLCYMPSTWQMYRYAKKHKIPFIVQTEIKHFPSGFFTSFATKILLRLLRPMFSYATFILPWTTDAVRFGKKHFGRKNAGKVHLLPSGLDTTIFTPKRIKKDTSALQLLMVSRMVPFKRYDDALKALRYLKDTTDMKFVLNIRGEGPLEKDIRARITKLGLDKHVRFLKRLPHSKMPELFSKQDIFLLPSYREAIGMVVPEAMACGIPAIVSDTSGATTYIKDGSTGYLFKTGDYKDLARKILLLKDKKKREQFGKRAVKDMRTRFDIKKTIALFDEFVTKSLKGNQKGRQQ